MENRDNTKGASGGHLGRVLTTKVSGIIALRERVKLWESTSGEAKRAPTQHRTVAQVALHMRACANTHARMHKYARVCVMCWGCDTLGCRVTPRIGVTLLKTMAAAMGTRECPHLPSKIEKRNVTRRGPGGGAERVWEQVRWVTRAPCEASTGTGREVSRQDGAHIPPPPPCLSRQIPSRRDCDELLALLRSVYKSSAQVTQARLFDVS